VIGVSNDLMFAESKNTSHQRRNGIFDGNQMSDYANVGKEPLVATVFAAEQIIGEIHRSQQIQRTTNDADQRDGVLIDHLVDF